MDNSERIRSISQEMTALQEQIPSYFREHFGHYMVPMNIALMMMALIQELDTLTAEEQTE